MNTLQSNHTDSRYPGSTCPDLWQTYSILSRQWYEHDIQHEHLVVLCGFRNELGTLLHLLPWSKSPLKSTTRLYRRERYKYPISSNDFPTIDIKTDEIPSSHEAEMFSKRIHPNVVWELWVSN
jgi:hypothetical protein